MPIREDFDWSNENEDVILPEQRATAVYINTWGQAVIRQKAGPLDEDDVYVAIDHANLPSLISALREIADEPASRHPLAEHSRATE